jgi:hypothetical protein
MRIVITLDESMSVGAYIEEVPDPTPVQCLALSHLAIAAGERRALLLGLAEGNGA